MQPFASTLVQARSFAHPRGPRQTINRAGGGPERNNAVGDGATTLNASPAKAGVHLSAAGAADRWVPAFPTDQVRGLKAHGKAVWAWFHTLWVGGAGGGLEEKLGRPGTLAETGECATSCSYGAMSCDVVD